MFFVTYSRTTPDSVDHGVYCDGGYATPGGWRYTNADPDTFKPENLAACALTLSEALGMLSSVDTRHSNGHTFYENDWNTVCYRTGTDENLALCVPRNITAASLGRVRRAIVKHCNGGRE
jgi:hypothetical protein